MNKYKVRWLKNDTYQVLELTRNTVYDEDDWEDQDSPEYYYDNVVHQGSLADCEAYIRLSEKRYM